MTVLHPDQPRRLTADAYLARAPDAFGDIEVVDGLVVYNMAQSELHDLVIRRLAAALENARPPEGPCHRISSDVAVRLAGRRQQSPTAGSTCDIPTSLSATVSRMT